LVAAELQTGVRGSCRKKFRLAGGRQKEGAKGPIDLLIGERTGGRGKGERKISVGNGRGTAATAR